MASTKFSLSDANDNRYRQQGPNSTHNRAPIDNPTQTILNNTLIFRLHVQVSDSHSQLYNPRSSPQVHHQPNYYNQAPIPQDQYNPYNPNSLPRHFHPSVKSLDIWSGSYSLDYTGRK